MTTTQQAHPWRAAARSAVGVLVALPAVLLGIAGVLALVAQDEFARYLPDGWAAWLLAASLFVAALAGLLSRIMAYPAVDQALEHFRLGSAPALAAVYPTARFDVDDHVITRSGRTGVVTMVNADYPGEPYYAVALDGDPAGFPMAVYDSELTVRLSL